jgi:NDP-sugar pyrophosphorylase family protein
MLMRKLLICPAARPAVSFLSQSMPLANAPFLGQSLLEYWLADLAATSTEKVIVLANDRPEQAQALVGEGERWGISAKVFAESRELTPAQAMLKYAPELDPIPDPGSIVVLDHLPGIPDDPLFLDYSRWFAALRRFMPRALTPDRVGVREAQPGVWVGSHSHISPGASLLAPCWIGHHVFIGAGAVIGPESIVENGAFIEPAAQVTGRFVGPDTFVGRYARIVHSIAWANTLIHWQTGTTTRVQDPFLMCALRRPRRLRGKGFFRRLAEIYAHNKEEVALVWKQLPLHKEAEP